MSFWIGVIVGTFGVSTLAVVVLLVAAGRREPEPNERVDVATVDEGVVRSLRIVPDDRITVTENYLEGSDGFDFDPGA